MFQKFVQNFQSLGSSLDAAGIHEHSDSAAQRRGREVAPESGADNATATVGAGHLAPNNTELGSILLGLGLVNVSQPLSKVPVNFLRCVHTFDLEERGAGVLVRFRPLVTEDGTPNIQPDALSLAFHHGCKVRSSAAEEAWLNDDDDGEAF